MVVPPKSSTFVPEFSKYPNVMYKNCLLHMFRKFGVAIFLLVVVVPSMASESIEITTDEMNLYELIMQYRKENNLSRIPLSPSLTYVAQTHAKDAYDHYSEIPSGCNMHSWSAYGPWEKCDYYPDHRNAECMWSKPRELTSYKGDGYEIICSYNPPTIAVLDPEGALDCWKSSNSHNSVILNRGIWSDSNWMSIGVGMFKGVACVWFGDEMEPVAGTKKEYATFSSVIPSCQSSAKPSNSCPLSRSSFTYKEVKWSEEMYAKYSYTDYTDYAAFNQPIDETDYNVDLLEAAMFYETNRQRVKYGLPQLKFDYNTWVCAHNHSVDMVNYDFYSHESPVAGKHTMSDRFEQVGYENCWCAENIAYCPIGSSYVETARQLVAVQWMNSSGHRKNILNSHYTCLGCGAAFYNKGALVYVKATQNFLGK